VTSAGSLRERLTIERPVRVADDAGGARTTWAALATVWAEVVSLGGVETALGERREARTSHRVTMRFRDDVTAEMRLVWRGRSLDIRGMRDPDGKRRWLAINAEEGAA
jgi:SPP1 family predicted phage head-tail adaptor